MHPAPIQLVGKSLSVEKPARVDRQQSPFRWRNRQVSCRACRQGSNAVSIRVTWNHFHFLGRSDEAEDRERGEAIAIRLLKKEFATSQHLPWLRREVMMARRIQHPNVCRVFDVVQCPPGGLSHHGTAAGKHPRAVSQTRRRYE